jgi:signal peptidase II
MIDFKALNFKALKEKYLPLSLTAGIILIDQLSKALIVKGWPDHPQMIKDVFNNQFLWIYHVRNKAIAFSLGENLPDFVKPITFIVIPLLVLAFVTWYFLKPDEFSKLQRWAAAGIIGGGLGNIIDRIFRTDGVVDFISVRLYGLFGLDRWPTFNLADSSVVVCCIILFISILFTRNKAVKEKTDGE